MSTLLPLLLATALLSTTAHADDKHHPPEAAKPVSDTADKFAAAHDHMKKMVAHMDRIRATKDPAERQRLMREHMDSMRQGPQSMHCPMMKDAREAQSPTSSPSPKQE